MSENAEQAALFEWASYKPELSLMYAIPNGGYRTPTTGAILKRTGTKSGVPDICLPIARGGYHALYIELKTSKGALSANQRVWLNALNEQGYKAVMCRGWDQARDEIVRYLETNSGKGAEND